MFPNRLKKDLTQSKEIEKSEAVFNCIQIYKLDSAQVFKQVLTFGRHS